VHVVSAGISSALTLVQISKYCCMNVAGECCGCGEWYMLHVVVAVARTHDVRSVCEYVR
jgi:hypothetical protein